MKYFFRAIRLLLLDMASTAAFLVVILLTHSIPLAVGLGVAFGIGQIGWQLARKRPISTMEWLSLFVVVASGSATLLTRDPRFVMLKPTLIYAVVGVVMLKPGWINRYLPPIAKALVPDIAVILGFAWAALMFLSAALNVVVALTYSVAAWAAFMSGYAIVSKLALFLVGYAVMRVIARRRFRAMPSFERDGLTALANQ